MRRDIKSKFSRFLAAALTLAMVLGVCPAMSVLAEEPQTTETGAGATAPKFSKEDEEARQAYWEATDTFWPLVDEFMGTWDDDLSDEENMNNLTNSGHAFRDCEKAVQDGLSIPADIGIKPDGESIIAKSIAEIKRTGETAIQKYNEIKEAYEAVEAAYENCSEALRDDEVDGWSINKGHNDVQGSFRENVISQEMLDYVVAWVDGYRPMRQFINASHEYLGMHGVNNLGQSFDRDGALDRYRAAVDAGEDAETVLALYNEAVAAHTEAMNFFDTFWTKWQVIDEAYNNIPESDKSSWLYDGWVGGSYRRIEANWFSGMEMYNNMPEVPVLSFGNAPKTTLNEGKVTDLLDKIELTAAEKAEYESRVIPASPAITMTVDDGEPDAGEQEKIDAQLAGYTVGQYLDINMSMSIGGSSRKVTDLKDSISLSITMPAGLRSGNRTYSVIRIHDGVAKMISGTYDPATGQFTFETDGFSSYTIVYKDEVISGNDESDDSDDDSNVLTQQTGAATQTAALSPKTGDAFPFVWLQLLLFAGAAAASAFVKLFPKRFKTN